MVMLFAYLYTHVHDPMTCIGHNSAYNEVSYEGVEQRENRNRKITYVIVVSSNQEFATLPYVSRRLREL